MGRCESPKTLAGADGFGWTIAATLLRLAGSRRGAGAPVWRLSRFSPLFETDLCGLTGLLGRRGYRPQSHAIGLRPHMSPPDADEGSNCNDNKRQGYCILHSKFSLCDLGSLGPGRNGEDHSNGWACTRIHRHTLLVLSAWRVPFAIPPMHFARTFAVPP